MKWYHYSVLLNILLIIFLWRGCFCECATCPELKDSILVYVPDTTIHHIETKPEPVHTTPHTKPELIDNLQQNHLLHDTILVSDTTCDNLLAILDSVREYIQPFQDTITNGEVYVKVIGIIDTVKVTWQHHLPLVYSYNYVKPSTYHFLGGFMGTKNAITGLGAYQSKKGNIYFGGYSTDKQISIGGLWRVR